MPWAFDKSVCPTRSTSAMYLSGMQLIYGLAGRTKHLEGLERAVQGGPEYMDWFEESLKAIAAKPWTHVVLLADAELRGVADAGALSFEWICRKPAAAYHLLDYRHGSMALTNKNMLVIAALADGNQYELALLADAAKTGAELIVYSDIPLDGLPDAATNISFGRSLPRSARGLPFLLISQIIACHRAGLDGVDPDDPLWLGERIKL
jgi:fructoselysine-6-P-deglycase FrlB-like protein